MIACNLISFGLVLYGFRLFFVVCVLNVNKRDKPTHWPPALLWEVGGRQSDVTHVEALAGGDGRCTMGIREGATRPGPVIIIVRL